MPSAPARATAPSRRAAWRRRRVASPRTNARSSRSPADGSTGIRAPAVGVVAAGHPDLVAVVDARRPRERHLGDGRQPDRRRVAAADRQDAGRVVAPEQVQLHGGDRRVVGAEQVVDPVEEGRPVHAPHAGADRGQRVDRRLVPVVAGGERDDRVAQRVVHVARRTGRPAASGGPRARPRPRCRPRGSRPAPGAGTRARTRRRRSRPATSSRHPSAPNRIQCSATPSRYSRTCGLSVLSLGSAGRFHQAT